MIAAGLTVLINFNAFSIALGSVLGFFAAQAVAGYIYQIAKANNRSMFYKVNLSDLAAIVADSFIFQLAAFLFIDWKITALQITIKFIGGLLWYFIIFKIFKLNDKRIAKPNNA